MNAPVLNAKVFGGRKVVDVDTHLVEPHDLWLSRAPAKYRDRVPQVKVIDGVRSWVIDGDKILLKGERTFADLTGSPAQLVAFASTVMTLYPGDVIFSGAADVGPVVPGYLMTIDIPRVGRMDVPVTVSPNARGA